MDMVRSMTGSLRRMVKVGALLSFKLSYFCVSYLLGAGTLSGSSGMCPLSGSFSLLRYSENPLREVLFLSKMVLMSYLEAGGEAVRSLVKSLFLP